MMVYDCINLHFTDYCNFSCKHCFVMKDNNELSLDEMMIIVDRISKYFKSNKINGRINIAGGEPLLSRNIDKLIDYIHSKNITVSMITNGYLLDEDFISRHSHKLNMIGISVDSLDYSTNIKMGRCNCGNVLSKEKVISLAKKIKQAGIKLKINTCLTKFNINEDFGDFINEIKPDRFKILQMVNSGKNKQYEVGDADIKNFLSKINYKYIFEKADEIQNSYLIVDSKGNLATNNLHSTKLSVLKYDIEEIISCLEINYINYLKRYTE